MARSRGCPYPTPSSSPSLRIEILPEQWRSPEAVEGVPTARVFSFQLSIAVPGFQFKAAAGRRLGLDGGNPEREA